MAIQGELVGRCLAGTDIVIDECNIVLNQPTVRDILQFGENDFFMALNFIIQVSNMLKEVQEEDPEAMILSELQLFLLMIKQEPSLRIQTRNFFDLVFPQYEVCFTENSIDFKQIEDEKSIIKGRIDPFNFEAFQNIVKILFLPYKEQKEQYNPKGGKAEEIARKLKEGKEKIAKQNNEEDISLFGSYISILSVGMNIDINILLQYTPFQLYDSFMRYSSKAAFDRYFAIATVPFADTSNVETPDEWTDNLYK